MRRAVLIVTLVSVGVWALLAIFALVGGEFGETQWRILLSSLLVTAAAAVAMACAVPLQAGHLGYVPWAGIVASVLGFGMLVVGVWSEASWDWALKAAASLVIAAVAVGIVGLVDGARVHPHHRWVVAVSQALTGFLGALLIAAVWGEIGNDLFWRGTGVVVVLMAAGVVAVPVLHRMAAIPAETAPDYPAVAYCPFCSGEAAGPLGAGLECAACGRSFKVLA